MRTPLAIIVMTLAATPWLRAQGIPFSQHGTVSQRIGYTDVFISYNRPVAHGRKLFGEHAVVPWGKVWHPGADSATTITFSKDVKLDGHHLTAGSYTLWTIPQPPPRSWTVIVSRAVHVFHFPYPGASYDVMRFPVHPEQDAYMEVLAYEFPYVAPDSAVLTLHWGTTIVPITIRTESP